MAEVDKDRVANATTAEEVLASGGIGQSIDAYLFQPLILTGFRRDSGEYGEFILLQVITASGSEAEVRTGSGIITEQVEKLEELSAFPQTVIIEKRPTKTPGRNVLRLVAVPA
jgi:hypothetical protein